MSTAAASPLDLLGDLHDLRGRSLRWTPVLLLVYIVWVFFIIEPHWFLGIQPLKKIPLLLFPAVLAIGLLYAPRHTWYWPLMGFVVLNLAHVPFAPNVTLAKKAAQHVFYLYALLLLTIAILTTARRIALLLRMYLVHFGWYGLQGIPSGTVAWHSILNNPDSFGPLMVIGIGFSYYWGMGSRTRWGRWAGLCLSLLCVVGVVASFARGAVIAAGVVLLAIWWKSPRKMATAIGGGLLLTAVIVAAGVLFPQGAFWSEMQTIGEGTDTGTTGDRWELWKVGFNVFAQNPIVGVGPENCGVWASQNYSFGQAGSVYANPSRLWGRSLHNVYVQLFCETGIVGSFFWFAMLIDFYRRIRRLKRPEAREVWTRLAPSLPDLRALATAFELAMIGYLASAPFYGQLYPHWFYTQVIVILAIDRLVEKSLSRVRERRMALRERLTRGPADSATT